MDKLISNKNIHQYIDTLKNQHVSSEKIKKILSSLAKFTQWSHKKGYLNNQPLSSTAIEALHKDIKDIGIKKDGRDMMNKFFFVSLVVLFLIVTSFPFFLLTKKKTNTLAQYEKQRIYEGKRTIFFQGRLTDNLGNPITENTDVRFKLYDAGSKGKMLYQSGTCTITLEKNGIFETVIGDQCGLPISPHIFIENQNIYLGVVIGNDQEMTPRQQIGNVAYADNSKNIQGYSIGNADNTNLEAEQGAQTNSIPIINQFGNLVIAAQSPDIWSTAGTFQLRGQALTLTTDTGSAGDIVFNPDTGGNTFFSAGSVGIRTENPLSFDFQIGGNAGPDKNQIYNLGSPTFRWNTIYTSNLVGTDTGTLGYVKRNNNAVSLTHLLDDLLIGDNASGSAHIKLTGKSGSIGIGAHTPQEKLTLGPTGNLATEMSSPTNIVVKPASGGALKEGIYYFKIVAGDNVGTTSGSSEVSCSVNGTSLTRCALSWDAVVGATSYRVYKGTHSGKQDRYQTASTHSLNYDGDGGSTLGSVPTVTTAYVSKWSAVGSSWMLGGNFGLGTTNPSKGKLQIDASRGVLLYTNNTGTGNSIEDASGAKLTASGVWTDASDQTKKKNINRLSYGLSELLKFNPVQYIWKDSGLSDIGFIAQEVQKIIPELVYGTEGNLSMSYGHLTALLVKSIQEQQTRIDGLFDHIIATRTFVSPVVETKDIIATGSAIIKNIETDAIQTHTLTTDEIVPKKSELTFEGISKLIINGLDNAHIAIFDYQGNASLSGTLTSEGVNTHTASISGTLTSDAILSNEVSAGTIYTNDATVSTTLKAKNIEADNITAIENKLSTIESNYASNESLSNSINDIQKLLAEIRNEPLPQAFYYQDIPINATNSANAHQLEPIFTHLTVSDLTNLYNASITNSLTIGNISVKDDSLLSLSWELKLSALSTIDLLDGAVIIAKDGSLTTRGAVIAQGGIRTNEIRPINSNNDLLVRLNKKSEIKNSKLKIKNDFDEEVAYINALGSAYFRDGVSVGKYTDATSSAVIIAASDNFNRNGIYAPAIETETKTAGVGLLPAYANEVIVYTNNLFKNSLIYITPTTQTQNKTLFVAQKESCLKKDNILSDETVLCKPYFKVALDKALNTEVKFNWWIVN